MNSGKYFKAIFFFFIVLISFTFLMVPAEVVAEECTSDSDCSWDDKCCNGECTDCPNWAIFNCAPEGCCENGDECQEERDYIEYSCSGSACVSNRINNASRCYRDTDGKSCEDCGECEDGDCEGTDQTKDCTESCSYDYCDGQYCKEKTITKDGEKTCSPTGRWRSCSANPDCPSNECNVDNDCCQPEDYKGCDSDRDKLYWYDSCGNKGDVYKDCSVNDGLYCNTNDQDLVEEREYSCWGGSCDNYSSETIKDCSTDDGWYCKNDYIREKRDYTCSDEGCEYDVDQTKDCRDYGDRSFCASSECQSTPKAYNLRINEPEPEDYCGASYPPITLRWDYRSQTDDKQNAYRLQISTKDDFSYTLRDTKKTSCSHPCDNSYQASDLSFNETYHWRVKVWDEENNESEWFSDQFTTGPKRADVDFSWSPQDPYSEEMVEFTNETTEGDLELTDWYWTFEDGDPPESDKQNPKVEFLSKGDKTVTLKATDETDTTCSETKEVSLGYKLPDWQETGFLDNEFKVISNFFNILGVK